MPRTEVKNEVFEDLTNRDVIFRNFAGKTDQYNQNGKRTFGIVLDPARAEDLASKGWNVKTLRSRDDEDDQTHFLPVEANMDGNYPPKVCLMSGAQMPDGTIDIRTKTLLDPTTIGELDHANLSKIDIIVTPYSWEWNGRHGIKAYAKAIYATTVLDPLELKYAGISLNDILTEDVDEEVPFN